MKTRIAPYRCAGGLHPVYHKSLTAGAAVTALPLPSIFAISLAQHLGAPARPLVKKNETVGRGQPLAEPAGFISAWIHAPTSGKIKAIDEQWTATGRRATVITLESDGEDRWADGYPLPPLPADADRKQQIDRVAAAGIAGMGGAGFPTHVKLSPPPGKTIDTLIINGAECEPYLTADHRVMIEDADRLRQGIDRIRRLLGTCAVRIAIEDNKPDAIKAMEQALQSLDGDVELIVLPSAYPQGAEKQLIYSVTGREVPSGGLPMDVGALVENVGTAIAVTDALDSGWPLTERVMTATGSALTQPANLRVRIGTLFETIIEHCGGARIPPVKVICGGPMMGTALPSIAAGVCKTTSGLLLMPADAVHLFESTPCIGCGRCVMYCPMRLMPCTLSEAGEAEDDELLEAFRVLDCIECGSCAYVCPAHRPMVQHMKNSKARIALMRRKRETSRQRES